MSTARYNETPAVSKALKHEILLDYNSRVWGMMQVSEGNVMDGVQRILGFYFGLFINKINVNGISIVLYGICFTTHYPTS